MDANKENIYRTGSLEVMHTESDALDGIAFMKLSFGYTPGH